MSVLHYNKKLTYVWFTLDQKVGICLFYTRIKKADIYLFYTQTKKVDIYACFILE